MAKQKRPQIEPARFTGQLSGINTLLNAIREQIQIDQGDRGDPLDRAVKIRDLTDAGVAEFLLSKRGKGQYASVVAPTGNQLVTAAPPNPENLQVNPTTATVYLTWDSPNYPYHAYTEVWRSTEDNLSTAVDLGARPAYRYYADPVDSGRTYYYWIRFVTHAGKKSDYNAVDGVIATTNLDPALVLETLNNKITSSQLTQDIRDELQSIPNLKEGLISESQIRDSSLQALQSIKSITGTDVRELKTLSKISNEETVRINQYSELVSSFKTLNSFTSSSITRIDALVSNESGARASQYEEILSQFQDQKSDISMRATKTELFEAVTSEQEARASQIRQLSTTVGQNTAIIQTQSESIDGLKTNWAVKFQIGSDGEKRVSGFGLSADGESTGAHFDVDQFSISKPGADALDFSVADVPQPDGTTKRMVVMDAASLVNLVVTNAMIENISADKITAGLLAAQFIDTENLTVKDAKSSNYLYQTSGWRLTKDGFFEINSSTDDGRIQQDGNGMKVYDRNGVLRVKMGKL